MNCDCFVSSFMQRAILLLLKYHCGKWFKGFFKTKKTILVSLSIISEWLTHIFRFYIFIQNKNGMKTKNPLLSHKLIQIKQYGWEIWYVFIVSSSAVSKSLNNRRYHVMSVNKFYCSVLYEITSFIIDKRFMQYGMVLRIIILFACLTFNNFLKNTV